MKRAKTRIQRGQALVEAAFGLLVFLVVFVAIMDFARGVWTYNLLAHAAREGTRYAVVHGKNAKSPASKDDIINVVKKYAIGLDPSKTTVTVTWVPDNASGSSVKVSVQYIFNFIGIELPRNDLTLYSNSQMVIF